VSVDESFSESELALSLLSSYQKSRYEEISRGQTLFGPHRDDIYFVVNGMDATAFASQGQQRSLVLSLKLAELKLLTEQLQESPVLLLDDVLAELDLSRQKLLMSLVQDKMQTIISTTHLNNFHEQWLTNALFIHVQAGTLKCESAHAQHYEMKNSINS
jgi:DNA replication and repair protein RecF